MPATASPRSPGRLLGTALLAAGLVLGASPPLPAATDVTLPDGQRVRLHPDFTWEYVDRAGTPQAAAEPLVLTVEARSELPNGCQFGLRLDNNADYPVRHITPQFSAFTRSGVKFQTVFKSFASIRPGRSRYKELEFNDISCDAIDHILVSGGDHCAMGDLDRYSPVVGECLNRVKVVASNRVDIRK